MAAFVAPEGLRFERVLGKGTMFQVALVSDGERELVCKRLTPRLRTSPEGLGAIVREAKALALLRHPALPGLLRAGRDGHGPFVLETFVEGRSLEAVVLAWRARGLAVPPLLVRHVARESTAALAELHGASDALGSMEFSHGDVAPDQLLLGPAGEVRFVDLGAARFRGLEPSVLAADRGTLPYVAPEVARGEVPPDAAADVYALAATLVFLAHGAPLLGELDAPVLLARIGEAGLPAPLAEQAPGFTPDERRALAAALRFHRAERMTRASELARAFV